MRNGLSFSIMYLHARHHIIDCHQHPSNSLRECVGSSKLASARASLIRKGLSFGIMYLHQRASKVEGQETYHREWCGQPRTITIGISTACLPQKESSKTIIKAPDERSA